MPVEFTFVPLQATFPAKRLRAYRQEAEWADPPQRAAADPRGRVLWVSVQVGREEIGIARLELAAPEFCFLSELIIRRNWRGKGAGRWFVQRIERYCAALGIRRLVLEAAPGSEAFYASLQFAANPRLPTMLSKELPLLQAKMFVPPTLR